MSFTCRLLGILPGTWEHCKAISVAATSFVKSVMAFCNSKLSVSRNKNLQISRFLFLHYAANHGFREIALCLVISLDSAFPEN